MRRRRSPIRKVAPDARYNDVDLARFINRIMWNGKKPLAQRIVYKALEVAEKQAKKPALEVFNEAI